MKRFYIWVSFATMYFPRRAGETIPQDGKVQNVWILSIAKRFYPFPHANDVKNVSGAFQFVRAQLRPVLKVQGRKIGFRVPAPANGFMDPGPENSRLM